MTSYGPLNLNLSVQEDTDIDVLQDMADGILKESKKLNKKGDAHMILLMVYGYLCAHISNAMEKQ